MSEAYWEDLYQKGDTQWEKGEASPGLVDFLCERPDLPKGTVLVPGCGFGHDVRAWAKMSPVWTSHPAPVV
jgi:methyl halide transferase